LISTRTCVNTAIATIPVASQGVRFSIAKPVAADSHIGCTNARVQAIRESNNPCSISRWHFTTGVVITADTSVFTTVAIVPTATTSVLVNVAETIAQAGRIRFADIWISAACKANYNTSSAILFVL
jgi:hypothetical protein